MFCSVFDALVDRYDGCKGGVVLGDESGDEW